MDNKKISMEEVETIINGLTKNLNAENKEKYAEDVNKVETFIKDNPKLNLEGNPENFALFVSHKSEMVIRTVLNDIIPENNHKREIMFLYEHYQYLDSQISSYIGEKIGTECCFDRSRYILKGFKNYLETGKSFSMDEDEYYICPFGTTEQWISFVKAVANTYYRFVTEKEIRVFSEMDLAAKKYIDKREAEEAAFIKRLNNTTIDFRMLMDLKIPVLISNMDEGRMFAILLDKFLGDEANPHANLKEFFVKSSGEPQIITIVSGIIEFKNEDKWDGKEPIPFVKIAKEIEKGC